MLKLANVSKRFGGLTVLQDVSFEVPPGKVFGLIGPNGAGKTTVFNLITGLLAPTSGTIELQGQSVLDSAPHEITRRGIGRTFQNIRVFKQMTLLENVVVGMHAQLDYGVAGWLFASRDFRAQERRAREKAHELLGWVGLAAKASDIADNLSYGDQRKLEVALSMAGRPRLLLLDEPMAGLASGERDSMLGLLQQLDPAIAVLLIEHDMDVAFAFAENVTVLYQGRVLATGHKDEVSANRSVQESYLGLLAR